MIYWCSLGIYPVPPIISAKTSEDIRKNIQHGHPHSPILCSLETLSNRWIHAQAELTWLFVSTKDILTIPYYPYFTTSGPKKHETHWASESIMMCCSLHFPFAIFQGMTASLFPLNKCGLPGLTGPLTRTCNTGGQQLQTCCFFRLFFFVPLKFSNDQCMCCHRTRFVRRLLWQKWTVQPLSHQPIADSGWLHPSDESVARSPQPVAPCTMTTGLRVTAFPSSWLWRLGRHLSIQFLGL